MVRKAQSLAEREIAGIAYLVRHINADGGIPAVCPGDASGGWTTVEAMEAIARSTWPTPNFLSALEKMACYAVNAQFHTEPASRGGWPFVSGSSVASTMATAHAALSLAMCKDLFSTELKFKLNNAISSAVDWLIRHQDVKTGGWGVEPSMGAAGCKPRVVSTFLALRALAAVGYSVKASNEIQRGVNYLWSVKSGGGFKSSSDALGPDVCSTARATTALLECGELTRADKRLELIIAFIRKMKPKDRLWDIGSENYIPDGASGQIIFNYNSTTEVLELLVAVGAEDFLQEKLVRWLCEHQCEDGSWYLGANETHKKDIVTWPTSEAVLALSRYIRSLGFESFAHQAQQNTRSSKSSKSCKSEKRNQDAALCDYGVDIAVLCALEGVEFKAVKALDWNWVLDDESEANDSSSYYLGGFNTNKAKPIQAVAVAASQMGMPAMAVLAMKVINRYRPRIIAIVGIAAAVQPPPTINFGDILFAEFSWDYGSGKLKYNNEKITLSPDPRSIPVDPAMRAKFLKLKDNTLALASIKESWPGNKPVASLNVHIGPIASGAAVVADSRIIPDIVEQQRKLIGIEMEIYSVFYAATHCSEPRPKPIAIKSVCDYGDQSKSDAYQAYAAFTSARALDLFVREYLEVP